MTDAYLKSWLDRVERLEEEQRGVGADKRDLYTEAKGKGYNVKALRRIVAGRRRKDEREVEAEIDRYKIALGLAVDLVRDEKLSLRDAAKRAGVSKSSVHRALAVPAASHDVGEIKDAPRGSSAARIDGQAAVDCRTITEPADLGMAGQGERCGALQGSSRRAVDGIPTIEPGCALDAAESERPAPAPVLTSAVTPEPDLTIPPFLDRRAA